MELKQARTLALELMQKHFIVDYGWKFNFDKSNKRFGFCSHKKKTISLSLHLTELNTYDDVKNVILHEIAHAIVGPNNGHNKIWKLKAIEIGCDGERCYSIKKVITPQGKYEAICIGCGHVHKKQRRSNRISSCRFCSGGSYNEKFKLEYKKTN